MQQLMKQAQKMQQQVAAAQEELSRAVVEGSSGGGLVTATLSGGGDVLSLKIKPEAVDPDDVESLEDLVVAALHDAAHAVQELQAQRMGPLTGGLGLPGM
jgi:DNA-binding YbaB/EbfC family protein